jgi:hypothetical protein
MQWTDYRFEQVEGEKQLQLLICFSSYLFYGIPDRVLFLERLMLTKTVLFEMTEFLKKIS